MTWNQVTWSNGGIGVGCVAKRLDRFLIGEALLEKLMKYRSWVDPARFSDHHPIFLKLGMSGFGPARPYKFNREWLKIDGFKELFSQVWKADD